MNYLVEKPKWIRGRSIGRRAWDLLVVSLAVALMLGSATTPGRASTGGSAQAAAAHVITSNATVLGVPLVTASDQYYVQAATPAPDATGNGSNFQQAGSLSQPGVFTSGVATAETHRTPAGLSASADIRDLSVGVLGVADLVSATDLSSSVECPIVEGSGVPVATTDVVGLEVAGTPASPGAVNIPVAVPLAIPGVASAEFLVSLAQTEAVTGTSADATALEVRATLHVLGPLGVELFNAQVLDMDLAQSGCTAPNAMAPAAFDIDPDAGPIGTLVTITGVGFVPGETAVQFGALAVSPPGIDVVDDGTELTFAVPAAATPGVVQVRATTPGGTTNPLTFTVTGGGGDGGADACSAAGAIVGTSGDDVLEGTAAHDVICGLGGDDVLRGLGGDDVLIGGNGNDSAVGDGGGDTISGGSGNDALNGGEGRDIIAGGVGNDVLRGLGGPDTLRGQKGADVLRGERGRDRLNGGGGPDRIVGGASADVAKGGSGNDDLKGGGSRDVLRGGPGNDTLKGGAKADTLNGGAGGDTCISGRAPRPVRKCERGPS